MNETLLAVLLGIAAELSGYPTAGQLPKVAFEPRAFFIEQACGGIECDVQGLYTGGDTIFIDVRHGGERPGIVSRSVIIHELVHYLQQEAGAFDASRCDEQLRSEMQAYAAQQRYLRRKGKPMPWDPIFIRRGCRD